MERSEEINQLSTALAKAQKDITGATKNVENSFLKSKYSDLAGVWLAIRIPLAENGLSVVQCPSSSEHGLSLETTIFHSSGEFLSSTLVMPVTSKKEQDYGKLLSYMRRYSLSSMVGVYQEDDDGGNPDQQTQEPKPNYIDEPTATALLVNAKNLETLGNECKKFQSDYKSGLTGWTIEQWNRICAQMKTNKARFEDAEDAEDAEDPRYHQRKPGF